jgi:4-hydroxybenzoate polyprenyltransferase
MSALLRRYRAERFPWTLATMVPLLLASSAQAGGARGLTLFGVDLLLAFLLFSQFRVLDDLADRSRDARVHPERVLVGAESVGPIVGAALLVAAGTVAVLFLRAPKPAQSTFSLASAAAPIVVYLGIVMILSAFYIRRADRTLLGDHLLLTKYPAFVWIIAKSRAESMTSNSSSTAQLALSMLATYLAACVYEALHDDRSPGKARPGLVFSEGVLLAATLATLSLRGPI